MSLLAAGTLLTWSSTVQEATLIGLQPMVVPPWEHIESRPVMGPPQQCLQAIDCPPAGAERALRGRAVGLSKHDEDAMAAHCLGACCLTGQLRRAAFGGRAADRQVMFFVHQKPYLCIHSPHPLQPMCVAVWVLQPHISCWVCRAIMAP